MRSTTHTTDTQPAAFTMPRLLLHLEGAALLAAAVLLYAQLGASGAAFLLLLLAPDLSMVGYLRGPVLGSALYNLAHTTTAPLLLAGLALLLAQEPLLALALIWLAHIGMDRMVGYGLKYPTTFKDTHLGRV